MHACDGLGDRDRRDAGEDELGERPAPRTARALRAVDAVQRLTDLSDRLTVHVIVSVLRSKDLGGLLDAPPCARGHDRGINAIRRL